MGQAKYYGHLEFVNIFLRALKRAGIPVKFTQGFHPKPKVSFDNPLALGLESENENITLTVPTHIDAESVIEGLNSNLPEGLRILPLKDPVTIPDKNQAAKSTYQVSLKEGNFIKEELASFMRRADFPIELKNRKGKLKKIDLKDMVFNIELIDSGQLQMTLRSEPGKTLRPWDALRHIFTLSEEQIKQARIVKIN